MSQSNNEQEAEENSPELKDKKNIAMARRCSTMDARLKKTLSLDVGPGLDTPDGVIMQTNSAVQRAQDNNINSVNDNTEKGVVSKFKSFFSASESKKEKAKPDRKKLRGQATMDVFPKFDLMSDIDQTSP